MTTDTKRHPLQDLKDKYDQLCAQRDRLIVKAQPLEDELDKVNAQTVVLQATQAKLASQIEGVWNSEGDWLELKSSISSIAKALSKPGGLLATKE